LNYSDVCASILFKVIDDFDDFDDFDDHKKPAEMLKTEMHKTAKVCKNNLSERKGDFSCNAL